MRRKKKQSLPIDKKSKKTDFRRTASVLTAFIMLAVLLGSVRWVISNLPDFKVFKLQNCYVEGRAIKLNGKEAFDYCLLSKAGSLLELDLETVRDRIAKDHPELKRVTVIKDYPDTVRIIVEERRPFAEVRAEQIFIVDEEGFVLSKNTDGAAEGLPSIIGVGSRYMKENTFNQSAVLKKAIEILKLLKATRFKDKYGVERVDVSNMDNISIYIRKGVEIKLGKDEFREKIEKVELPLSNLDLSKIKYIDLRFNDLIVGPK